MSELERQLAGVKVPDSPPEEKQAEAELSAEELEKLGEDPPGAEEGTSGEDDRPVLNLKREFDRKMGNMRDEIVGLKAKLSSQPAAMAQPTPEAAVTEPSTDNMSIDQ